MTRTHVKRWFGTLACFAGITLLPETMAAQTHYLGEIKWVAFDVTPNGWAECDGEIQSLAQNTALFALLGTTYGGNGQTTFALPDVRSRFIVHQGAAPGLSPRDLGQSGGEEAHALTVAELPAHSHAVAGHTHEIPPLGVEVTASSAAATAAAATGRVLATATLSGGNGPNVTGNFNAGPADVSLRAGTATTAPGTTSAAGAVTSAVGSGTSHPIVPPFVGLRCIIATKGAFPPRS